ncbi:hypothetical protein GPECTOR_3g259 [Gonium pectorale]|uniref:SRCR domain-containing protein n=1 Tax=Gonium pectorale TaxID=33097 RepID=A0A150GZ74_GONPE|nr:hypothetical protein GPECTOR_3g259 [Gonium pectorale]|eukprot:KXZ55105.1 hypothetical protein GPECTOR_3g259 [Gonium pectorale]
MCPSDSGGALRLRGGASPSSGRLEVCHDGSWGTVCAPGFGAPDAQVACRQLGYSHGVALPTSSVPPGHPDSPTWMGSVGCGGAEARLADCPFPGWGRTDCWSHILDAGVACFDALPPPSAPPAPFPPPPAAFPCSTAGELRLVDYYGRIVYDAGRLEICLNGRWGTT